MYNHFQALVNNQVTRQSSGDILKILKIYAVHFSSEFGVRRIEGVHIATLHARKGVDSDIN